MKAISLWQPWATLVACGAKRIETRSWAPNFRGRLAIHAAKTWSADLNDLCDREPFRMALNQAGFGASIDARGRRRWVLPWGVLAVCRLTEVYSIGQRAMPGSGGRIVLSTAVKSISPDDTELHFGDYTPGRFGWMFERVEPVLRPLLIPGRQGLFDIPDDLMARSMEPMPADAQAEELTTLF